MVTYGGKIFFTPKQIAEEQTHTVDSPRGRLLIASCRSGSYLAIRVINRYQELLAEAGGSGEVLHLDDIDYQFSDSETSARLAFDASGFDVFLFQALYDPTAARSVDENYLAFLIAARTFKEKGSKAA